MIIFYALGEEHDNDYYDLKVYFKIVNIYFHLYIENDILIYKYFCAKLLFNFHLHIENNMLIYKYFCAKLLFIFPFVHRK